MLVVGIDWHTCAFEVLWRLVLILREERFALLSFSTLRCLNRSSR